tara:strand:- start:160 stop:699 length:540 start_codon:yes stop_codon:yes gene_type:complete
MSSPNLADWNPVAATELREMFGEFADWFLCGGVSIDIFAGRQTRLHGDIDVGVYRSDILNCLHSLARDCVYICDPPGTVVHWDGGGIEDHVNDIWITSPDGTYWILQILLYTDHGDNVIFKRDPAVTWQKSAHTIECDGYRILNPAISLLYKASRGGFEPRDAQDIATIIGCYASRENV